MANVYSQPKHDHNMISIVAKLAGVWSSHFLFIGFTSMILGFIMPVAYFLALMGALVIADTITGALGAIKTKEKIESRKAYRTVEKVAVYSFAILLSHGIQLILIDPIGIEWLEKFTLGELVTCSICFTEFLSLRENIKKMTNVDILGGFKKAATAFMDIEPSKKEKSKFHKKL